VSDPLHTPASDARAGETATTCLMICYVLSCNITAADVAVYCVVLELHRVHQSTENLCK